MKLRATLKKAIPAPVLNRVMLTVPRLQRLSVVNYESNLDAAGLDDLQSLVKETASIPGEVIECGSSRCGTSILMARWLEELGRHDKTVFALDSFSGFNPDELARERANGLTTASSDWFKSTNFDYVRQKIEKLGLSERVVPVQGYFEDTLSGVLIAKQASLALIDCDLHDPMLFCARTIWPQLSPGGVIAFDDYESSTFPGAKQAVDEFVAEVEPESHRLMKRLYMVRKP